MADIQRSIESSLPPHASSAGSHLDERSTKETNDGREVQRPAIFETLPTYKRVEKSLFDPEHLNDGKEDLKGKTVIDVSKLGAAERHFFVEKLLKEIEEDNLRLLKKQKERIGR